MAPSARSAYLDNAKAVLITLVVLAHSLGLLASQHASLEAVYRLIYCFHMPAFVFVTGYLSKPDAFSPKGLRGVATLVWTFLLFNGVNYVWEAAVEGRPLTSIDPVDLVTRPAYTLWFLVALVWWRLLLPLFALGESRGAAAASIVAGLAAAVASGYLLPDGGWLSVSRVFVFLPFFVAGYRAKQRKWAVSPTLAVRALAVAAFMAVFAALYLGGVIRDTRLLMHSSTFVQSGDLTLRAGLVRLGLLVVAAVLTGAFLALVPHGRSAVSALGATTVSVYVWHAFTLRNLRWFGFDDVLLGSVPALALSVAAMVLIFGYGPIPRATLWLTSLGAKKART